MKIEIKNQKDNPFLKRKELDVLIDHSGEPTPAKAAVQRLMAKELGKGVENVEIKNIFSIFGQQRSKSKIFVWDEKKVPDLSTVKKEKKEKKPRKDEKEERSEEKIKEEKQAVEKSEG